MNDKGYNRIVSETLLQALFYRLGEVGKLSETAA